MSDIFAVFFFFFSDEEYGQKNVSVMLDGQETELEIIDHPAAEMSVSKMFLRISKNSATSECWSDALKGQYPTNCVK